MASSRCALIALVTAGAIATLVGLLAVTLHQRLFATLLDKKLELTPTSAAYSFWHTLPVPIYMKFYLWNVSNAHDVVTKNARPILVEVGPYVYREKHLKVNMTWNKNNTVTYQQVKTWFFEPDLSVGSLDENVTTLNVPLLAAAALIHDFNFLVKDLFNEMLYMFHTTVFVTHSVREFLFDGYNDPLLEAAQVMQHFFNITVPFDRFGWFYARNNSNYYDGVFNMDTGHNVTLLGDLHFWNNTNHTTAFQPPCNRINGSTGELFHPRLDKTSVEFYSTDICRSLRVPYKEDMTKYGLAGHRYQADEMMFAQPDKNPDNWCFCNGECPPAGLLDESACRFDVPAFVSFPHMLYADPAVINQTVGQQPNESLHNFHLDVEPMTGVPLSLRARFQINMLLKPNPDVTLLHKVPTVYLPMLWFDNTVDTTTDIAGQFVTMLHTVPTVMSVSSFCLLALGLTLLAAAGLLVCVRRVRVRPPGLEPLTASSTQDSLDSDGQ